MEKINKPKRRIPFQNMTSDAWVNLALAATVVFYLLQVVADLFFHPICQNMAVDYCAYWTAGKLVTSEGYTTLNDLDALLKYQYPLYPHTGNPPIPIPFIYLPAFILPFQLLSFIPLRISYLIWTLINLIGFAFYLRFFFKSTTGQALPNRLLFLCLLSLPVFSNLFWGQLNIMLGIFIGEVLRALLSGKSFKAGLWLGGLLLKPFTLILILPILLLRRSFKTLVGFTLALVTLLGISFGLVGSKGFADLMSIYLESARGGSASNPTIMMNWRMLGIHVTPFLTPSVGWTVVIIGTLLTLIATWFIIKWDFLSNRIKAVISLLGIFAASSTVAWHAHFTQSLLLIPFLIYLYANLTSARRLLLAWVFIPIALTFIAAILAATSNLAPGIVTAINMQTGIRSLLLNLGLLAWALSIHFHKSSSEAFQAITETR